jgi:protein kinase-like protein
MLMDPSPVSARDAQERSGTRHSRSSRRDRPALVARLLPPVRLPAPLARVPVLLRQRPAAWAWLGAVGSAFAGCSAAVLASWLPNALWLRQLAMVQLLGVTLFSGLGLYIRQQNIRDQSRGAAKPSKGIASTLAVAAALSLFGSIWQLPRELRPDLINLALLPAVLIGAAISLWLGRRRREKAKEAHQLGQYALVQRIGGGGMGVVYKAEHTSLRRPTAVKVLQPEKTGEQSLLRFEREARMTARLCHPNTVSVYDYGRTPGGTFYYAMEYIEGIDLDMLVQHDGPQHPGRVIQIVSQICGSLAEAHALGLIHQDIKPANVFLCERAGMVDVVKVLDFGLVKHMGETRLEGDAASRQKFSGTPNYIAPEAILSEGELDGRTDIYAVGCLTHYLLTGAPPFSGNTVLEVLGQHLHAKPRPFAEQSPWPMSSELEQVVLSCLGKSRVHRPNDTATLYALLQGCPEAQAWDQAHGRHWWTERGASLQAQIAAARNLDNPQPGQRGNA